MKPNSYKQLQTLILLHIVIGISNPILAQSPRPPAKQWDMQYNNRVNASNSNLNTIDWTLGVIQTHDDNYVAVGFSSSDNIPDQQGLTCTVNYNPAIYKTSSKGGTIIWSKIADQGFSTQNWSNDADGRYIDVCESFEQDNKYYFTAIGHKKGILGHSGTGSFILVTKYNEDGSIAKDASGNNIEKYHRFDNNSGQSWGTSIRPFKYLNVDYFVITGEDNYRIFAAILDKDLNLAPNILSSTGYIFIQYAPHTTSQTEGRGYSARVAHNQGTMPNGTHNGAAEGIYLSGYIVNGKTVNYPTEDQLDGYLCKFSIPSTQTNGTKTWERIFASDNNINNLTNHHAQSPSCVEYDGLDQNGNPKYREVRKNFKLPLPYTIPASIHPNAVSEDDHVFGFEETDDGNLIVTQRYHMSICDCKIKNDPPQSASDFYPVALQRSISNNQIIQYTYLDFMKGDIYLSIVDQSNGNIISNNGLPQYVTHMSGDDFWTQVKQTYDKDASGNYSNFVVFGTTSNYYNESAPTQDPWDESETQTPGDEDLLLLKYSLNGSGQFIRKWSKVFHGPGGGACGFALAPTRDGGFIVGANNDDDADNHVLVKVANDCKARAFNEPTVIGVVIEPGQPINSVAPSWSTDKIVTGSIVIQSGGVLTINNNAKIQFNSFNNIFDGTDQNKTIHPINNNYKRVGIIVEPGGKLIVDNAILTNYEGCSNYGFEDADRLAAPWDGILVKGTSGADMSGSGFAANFGIVEIKNNATLKNAITAITVGENYGEGGILKVLNASFLNNRKSIAFLPFIESSISNFNRSFIRNTSFLNDATITGWMNKGTNQHISAWGVRGIKLSSISIKNQLLNNQICDEDRGIGLSTFDSDVDITRYFDVNGLGAANEMEGLRTGVQSLNTGTSSPFFRVNVSGTNFLNVQEGIILENNVAPVVTCNNFTFNLNLQPTSKYLLNKPYGASGATHYGFGVYTTFTNAFHIVNNTFSFDNANVLSFASITEQAGGGDLLASEIKLNTITNTSANKLHFGMEAFGGNDGLAITCNTYNNLSQDWYIDNDFVNIFLSCAGNCFPNQLTENSSKVDPLNVFTSSCTSSSNEHILSKIPFEYYVKNSANSPICYTSTKPSLISVQNTTSCVYPCGDTYINAPDGEFEGLGKRAPKKKTPNFGEIDSLWQLGKFDLMVSKIAKSDEPLNQLLAKKYDIANGTNYCKSEITNEYLNLIANGRYKNNKNISKSELDNLKRIAFNSNNEAISAQNLYSLITDEKIYRKAKIPNTDQQIIPSNAKDEKNLNAGLLVFPNPTSNAFTINLNGVSNEFINKIELIDILGNAFYYEFINEQISSKNIALLNIKDGIYFVKVYSTENKIYTQKIICILK